MATIKEELNNLNDLRHLLGMPPLKSWKQSMDKLMAKQAELRAEFAKKDVDTAIEAEAKTPAGKSADNRGPQALSDLFNKPAKMKRRATTPNAELEDDQPKTRHGGLTIASVVRSLLLESYDENDTDADRRVKNLEIFKTVNERHPGLLPEKKKWYVAWYRSQMARKGLFPGAGK